MQQEQKDIRIKILDEIAQKNGYADMVGMIYVDGREEKLLLAFDSYFEKRSMQLLQWMGENNVECSCNNTECLITGEQLFYYKGEWITKEELFQNFL